ncbi:MAG: DUF4276 family protein [Euryarchaeota archaeon]|nr:DUF4276 family protein [Euryarchaeota archaeon]
MPDNWRIVVLIDEDRQDCNKLKLKLENAAIDAGLTTRTSAEADAKFQVLNRILVEELEAWFFGDSEALHSAYSMTFGYIDYSDILNQTSLELYCT